LDRLNSKVALISGAARGIGAAIAEAFVREGGYVCLTDIEAATGAARARELGDRATFRRLDVRKEKDWDRVCGELISQRGRIDIVVNNAGVTGFEAGAVQHDPENASLADWRAVHCTNLDGVFLGCKYAIRAMRPNRSGSIINISSGRDWWEFPGRRRTLHRRRQFVTTPRVSRFGVRNRGSPFGVTRFILPRS
jgi:NAD(P)-dependent dehydrogenase (short-subunit alcohol dehydrogenase family)